MSGDGREPDTLDAKLADIISRCGINIRYGVADVAEYDRQLARQNAAHALLEAYRLYRSQTDNVFLMLVREHRSEAIAALARELMG